MTIDFESKKDEMMTDKLKRDIISQCAINAFISATQEINSVLQVLKDNNMTGADILNYADKSTDILMPYCLKDLTKLHGENLIKLSKALGKRLSRKPALTIPELTKLSDVEKEIFQDYIIDNNPIIFKEMDKYAKELLEMDSI